MRLTRISLALSCAVSMAADAPAVGAQPAAPRPAGQAAVSIDHRAVRCVVAERFPVIEARLAPAEKVTRARVFFRAAGTPSWYYVEMRPERGSFLGTLPKPMKATTGIEYYIAAIDNAAAETRSADYSPQVVAGEGACPSGMLSAAFVTGAKIAVGALAGGTPAVPLGFSSAGILAAGSVGGAAASGAAASGAGGGISTGAVVGIVAGAGALAAGAVVVAGGGETWVGTASLSPADRHCTSEFAMTLTLKLGGSELSGKMETFTATSRTAFSGTCNEPVGTSVINHTLTNGSVSGSNVTFAFTVSSGGNTFTFTGTQSGGSMEGMVQDRPGAGNVGAQPRDGTWRIMRQ